LLAWRMAPHWAPAPYMGNRLCIATQIGASRYHACVNKVENS
jgi:hypothetical protein